MKGDFPRPWKPCRMMEEGQQAQKKKMERRDNLRSEKDCFFLCRIFLYDIVIKLLFLSLGGDLSLKNSCME